ncbi:MAG: hypothetical protein DSZ28_03635 [Thiothrix sp.]|nr:MAG: hypothetical protein DSZ28_03635 [Thiothrix sp.]
MDLGFFILGVLGCGSTLATVSGFGSGAAIAAGANTLSCNGMGWFCVERLMVLAPAKMLNKSPRCRSAEIRAPAIWCFMKLDGSRWIGYLNYRVSEHQLTG